MSIPAARRTIIWWMAALPGHYPPYIKMLLIDLFIDIFSGCPSATFKAGNAAINLRTFLHRWKMYPRCEIKIISHVPCHYLNIPVRQHSFNTDFIIHHYEEEEALIDTIGINSVRPFYLSPQTSLTIWWKYYGVLCSVGILHHPIPQHIACCI